MMNSQYNTLQISLERTEMKAKTPLLTLKDSCSSVQDAVKSFDPEFRRATMMRESLAWVSGMSSCSQRKVVVG